MFRNDQRITFDDGSPKYPPPAYIIASDSRTVESPQQSAPITLLRLPEA